MELNTIGRICMREKDFRKPIENLSPNLSKLVNSMYVANVEKAKCNRCGETILAKPGLGDCKIICLQCA
jgi:hypothetical protein